MKRRTLTARARSSPSLTLPSGVVLRLGDFRLYTRRKARLRERDLAARTSAEKERLQRRNRLVHITIGSDEILGDMPPPLS